MSSLRLDVAIKFAMVVVLLFLFSNVRFVLNLLAVLDVAMKFAMDVFSNL